MAYTQEEVNRLVQEAATQAGGSLSYADAMAAASKAGITADQLSSAANSTGLITPSISYTPAPDSEGSQSIRDNYAINGKGVTPIYDYIGTAGGDYSADYTGNYTPKIAGYYGGIEHIGDQDYIAQYDASGNLLGYRPYAGESFFSSTVKPLLPIIASAIAPGLGGLIGGATGLTGAGLSAATGATLGGGIAALTGQNVLKGAALGGLGGYAGSQLNQALNAGVTDAATLQAAADADIAGGLLPEYGTNAAYDTAMANLMANSPGAAAQLQSIVDSQVGGLYGPDNIDIGGGWSPATNTIPDALRADNIDVGGGYNPATGTGDAATAAAANATGVTSSASIPTAAAAGAGISASTLAKLAALGLGSKGVASLVNNQGNNTITGGGGSGAGPLSGYNFDPSKFQATTPDPAMFRPGAGIVTVADMLRNQGFEQPQVERPEFAPMQPAEAQQNLMGGGIGGAASTVPTIFMAKGGSTKPTYSTKAQLAAMNPWERSVAELNNAAYAARMPTGTGVPQAGITQLGQFARGGIADLGSYSDGGRMLKGGGDGMSDSIPATIGGKQPARLADGEFVIPADVVSGLGNGSTDAGARQLYKMLDRVRKSRTGTKKQGKEIDAQKHMPA